VFDVNGDPTSSLAPAGKPAYIPRGYKLKPPQVFMENVILIIHLILALGLIAVVLLQRSEGGGLGMGGGGGGAMTGRAAATALGKLTWILAVAFIITSMTLTILAAQKSSGTSVLDRLGTSAPAQSDTSEPESPADGNLPLPAEGDDAPLVPKAD
jgi:preprotein translocase subunit SecG